MSEANKFRETHALRGRLDQISPEEFVKLINGVCNALEQHDSSFHGNINAANISMDEEGNVALGEALAGEKSAIPPTRSNSSPLKYSGTMNAANRLTFTLWVC